MKKLVFAAVAAIALTASVSFVSCNQPKAEPVDSLAVDTEVVEEVLDTVAAAIDSAAAVVDSVVAEVAE